MRGGQSSNTAAATVYAPYACLPVCLPVDMQHSSKVACITRNARGNREIVLTIPRKTIQAFTPGASEFERTTSAITDATRPRCPLPAETQHSNKNNTGQTRKVGQPQASTAFPRISSSPLSSVSFVLWEARTRAPVLRCYMR